jgi:hypothetical protein
MTAQPKGLPPDFATFDPSPEQIGGWLERLVEVKMNALDMLRFYDKDTDEEHQTRMQALADAMGELLRYEYVEYMAAQKANN